VEVAVSTHHTHECPVCERHFGCLKEVCRFLYYRLCGACKELRDQVEGREK